MGLFPGVVKTIYDYMGDDWGTGRLFCYMSITYSRGSFQQLLFGL